MIIHAWGIVTTATAITAGTVVGAGALAIGGAAILGIGLIAMIDGAAGAEHDFQKIKKEISCR